MKTIPFGPFLGVNNRLPDSALVTDPSNGECFLKSADNVDVDNAHRVRLRHGRSLIQAMTQPHSWIEIDATHGYLVRSSVLYSVDLTSGYSETLLKVLASNEKMSYLPFNGDMFFSNGTDSGRISGALVYPWALQSPVAPVLTAIAGTLPRGIYQVALNYANSVTGEEGGAAGVSVITLATDNAGIRVTLPGASPGATHLNVFISAANGKAPYLHTTLAIGPATSDITTSATGRMLRDKFEAPMPAGLGLFIHMGRLCAKKGKGLYYGTPYRHGYYDPSSGHIPFEADVSVAIPNQAGVYVVADKTRWFPGDLGDPGTVEDVLPYGAVPDTQFILPNNSKVGWFGLMGIVLADTQGKAESVMDQNCDPEVPASGVSCVFVDRGYLRVYSCGYCMNLENLAYTTYSNYAFTSLSGTHGTLADGLYSLEGGNDSGQDIDNIISFGKYNFGSELLKRIPHAYIDASSDEPMQIRLQWQDKKGGQQDYTYTALSRSDGLAVHRFDFGRGAEAVWFDIELRNQLGSDFIMASLSLAPKLSTRRI